MVLYYNLGGKRSAYVPRLIRSDDSQIHLKGLAPLRQGMAIEVAGPFDASAPGGAARSAARVLSCDCGPDGLFHIAIQVEAN